MELNTAKKEVETKKCPCCGEILPVSEFYKDKFRPDGFSVYCKKCKKKRSRKYYYQHRWGSNGILARYHRKYWGDIHFRIKEWKRQVKYYQEHKDEIIEKKRIQEIRRKYWWSAFKQEYYIDRYLERKMRRN